MQRNRLNILMESRTLREEYVRFGGEYLETCYLKGWQGAGYLACGMQGHWSMQDITREDIQKSIDMFSSLGLDIHITELDLTVYTTYHGEGAKNQVKETRAWTPELAKQQADMYKMIFEVLRANKGKISSVTFWGLADNYTWLHNFPVPNRHDYPLVFDNELNAKQSFWNIVEF